MEKKISWKKCIGVILCAGFVGILASIIANLIPQGSLSETEYTISVYCLMSFIQAAGLMLLLVLFGRKDVIKSAPRGSFLTGAVCGTALIGYGAYMLVINLIESIRDQGVPSMSLFFMIIYIVAIFFGAGIGEEFIFRGIFMNFVRSAAGNDSRKALMTGMTVSSVCFGLVHLSNLQGNEDVIGTVGQVIYAIGIGFYLAAIYARTKNIWFNVVLHFFVDISALLKTLFIGSEVSISEVIGGDPVQVIIRSVIIGAVFGGMGLFIIRKSKMPELT